MTVYIDMDGTLTPYDYDDYINNKWLTSPEILCKPPLLSTLPRDVIILTCVSTRKEAHLKKEWARQHFPNNKIITTSPGTKHIYATGNILIDDNNDNLRAWEEAGGFPVKCINNVNRESAKKMKGILCVEMKGGQMYVLSD